MKELSYKDDNDKCYGATGMAIGVIVLRGHGKLTGISVDAAPGSMMEFTDDFYFTGNQGMMATASWHMLLENFNVMAAMMVSNVLCRNMVANRRMPDDDVMKRLRDIIVEEGVESCSLEPEEAARLYDNNYKRFRRIFSNSGVHAVAREFMDILQRKRHLSRIEIVEELRALEMI